jgi:lysozyme
MSTQGIDVSRLNGTLDWGRISQAGIAFAYIKATEGLQNDPNSAARIAYFQSNWQQAADAGVLRGAYHFFRANDDSELQADQFLMAIGAVADADLPPMLDVETDDGTDNATIILRVHRCLERIQSQLGVTPLVYTYASFWNAHLDAGFGAYPLWIAAYGPDQPMPPVVPDRQPTLPVGWDSWVLWQYGSKGQVDGIDAVVDLDLFAGSVQDLLDFASAMQTPPGS